MWGQREAQTVSVTGGSRFLLKRRICATHAVRYGVKGGIPTGIKQDLLQGHSDLLAQMIPLDESRRTTMGRLHQDFSSSLRKKSQTAAARLPSRRPTSNGDFARCAINESGMGHMGFGAAKRRRIPSPACDGDGGGVHTARTSRYAPNYSHRLGGTRWIVVCRRSVSLCDHPLGTVRREPCTVDNICRTPALSLNHIRRCERTATRPPQTEH